MTPVSQLTDRNYQRFKVRHGRELYGVLWDVELYLRAQAGTLAVEDLDLAADAISVTLETLSKCIDAAIACGVLERKGDCVSSPRILEDVDTYNRRVSKLKHGRNAFRDEPRDEARDEPRDEEKNAVGRKVGIIDISIKERITEEVRSNLHAKGITDAELEYWIGELEYARSKNPRKFDKEYSNLNLVIQNWRRRAVGDGKSWNPDLKTYAKQNGHAASRLKPLPFPEAGI